MTTPRPDALTEESERLLAMPHEHPSHDPYGYDPLGVDLLIRDFDIEELRRRLAAIEAAARADAIEDHEKATGCRFLLDLFKGSDTLPTDDLTIVATSKWQAAADAERERDALRAIADEARLVSQWGAAVDPMPDELRAELLDLSEHARAAAGEPEAAPVAEEGRYASRIPLRSYSERTGR